LVQVSFGLLGYLAGADSIVTTHEAEFANHLMDEMALPANGRDMAQAAFLAGRQRKIDVDAEMKRFLATFNSGSSEVIKLYDALLQLAIADGRVRPTERIFLEKVTKGLGFSPQALAARLGEATKGAN
jgi:DnaJ-domain-containing protein 1